MHIMKKQILTLGLALCPALAALAQGWPAQYGGVMLQGFYWDSFVDSRWTALTQQSDELSQYFKLIWVPQSGNCNSGHNTMGYLPVYLFDHNSSFGSTQELRNMISTFKAKGTGIVADVVINHRNNLGVGGSWVDYPAETYNGKTYQMTAADIVANDDAGKTATWAASQGLSLSSRNDSGDGWDGCRDIDHYSDNVRENYKAYLNFLLNDLGYTGFRYDMVKGYSPAFTAEYNTASQPAFSVGEYWDGSPRIKSWIDGTKVNGTPTSAAFDFQFRYAVRDAVNNGNWAALSGTGKDPLAYDSNYQRYAVTFVENHDTQYRSATEQLDPIKRDTLAANAFMLAMPGTPCVFLRHWQDYKQEIKAMIDLRQKAGITNTSSSSNFASAADHYAVRTVGTNADLICVVGSNADAYQPNQNYVLALSGYHYRYYLSKSANTAWIDVASGEYDSSFSVRASAISTSAAELVYTLDGSTPTAASSKVSNGTIQIAESCTLKVGLLQNGSVTGIVTREYVIKPFVAYTATIHVRNENSWSRTNFYIWDSNNNTQLNGAWPGKAITATKEVDGQQWYYQTVNIPTKGYYVNLVVSTGTGSPQTLDVPQISSDKYYVITQQQVGGKYVVNDVTNTVTSINAVVNDTPSASPRASIFYDLAGRRVTSPQRGQLLINGLGQKILF